MAKKKAAKKVKIKGALKQPKPQKEENENPLDFGGLPERNLKKNLGC
jgi:hypothetical protein